MSMRAIGIKNGHGPPSAMFVDSIKAPSLETGKALIKVYAAGVNRMDLLQRSSAYPLPAGASPVLGVEFAGVISQVGPEAATAPNGTSKPGFKVGDKVFGLAPGGAYADVISCDLRTLMLMPRGLSFNQAAALPETWFTAIQVLKFVGEFKKRDKVLIHAGASGIGVAVVQLAQTLGCRRVFATVSSQAKVDFVKNQLTLKTALGDEVVPINYKEDDYVEQIKKYDPEGVNVIIDPVGGEYVQRDIEALAPDGRLVLMGLLSGQVTSQVNVANIIYKRLRLHGSTLRSQSPAYQQQLRDFFVEHLLPRFETGKLSIHIDSTYPLSKASEAHERMASNSNHGKIIITVNDQPFDGEASG